MDYFVASLSQLQNMLISGCTVTVVAESDNDLCHLNEKIRFIISSSRLFHAIQLISPSILNMFKKCYL